MDVTAGLYVTIAEKDKQKYEQQKDEEQKIRSWIASLLPNTNPDLTNEATSLHSLLKDGVILCELINQIIDTDTQDDIKKLKLARIHRPGLPFKEMENITNYLNTCKRLGLAKEFCFETNDLYDGKGMTYVLNNLSMLRRLHAQRTSTESPFAFVPAPAPSSAGLPPIASPSPNVARRARTASGFRASSSSPTPSSSSSRSSVAVADDVQAEDEEYDPYGREDGCESPESFFQQDLCASNDKYSGPSVPSLDDDMKTKASFSYNSELEKIVKDWIECVLGYSVFDKSQTFAEALKSGVVLCSLVNKIQPYTVKKIHESEVAYKQIENIGNYIKACGQLGLPRQDNFDVPDLYNEKNMTLVLEQIHRFARFVTTILKVENIPLIHNPTSVDLWTSTLVETGAPIEMIDDAELTQEQHALLTWVNGRLGFLPSEGIQKMSELRTGLYLLKLLEVVSGGPVGGYARDPTTTWHYMQNVSLVFRFLSTQFMERVPNAFEPDVVMGKSEAITNLVRYIRSQYDRDYYLKTEVRSSVLEMFGDHNVDDDEFVKSVLDNLNLEDEGKTLEDLEKYLGKLSSDPSGEENN